MLHALRQIGKTSCRLGLRDLLNQGGRYQTVYANLETVQVAREDVAMAMAGIVQTLLLGRPAVSWVLANMSLPIPTHYFTQFYYMTLQLLILL